MVFGLFILKFIGFYLLYTNSGKTTYAWTNLELRIRRQKTISRVSGYTLIVFTLFACIFLFGFAGGLFYDLTLLMLIASLTILFRPLLTKERAKNHVHAGK